MRGAAGVVRDPKLGFGVERLGCPCKFPELAAAAPARTSLEARASRDPLTARCAIKALLQAFSARMTSDEYSHRG